MGSIEVPSSQGAALAIMESDSSSFVFPHSPQAASLHPPMSTLMFSSPAASPFASPRNTPQASPAYSSLYSVAFPTVSGHADDTPPESFVTANTKKRTTFALPAPDVAATDVANVQGGERRASNRRRSLQLPKTNEEKKVSLRNKMSELRSELLDGAGVAAGSPHEARLMDLIAKVVAKERRLAHLAKAVRRLEREQQAVERHKQRKEQMRARAMTSRRAPQPTGHCWAHAAAATYRRSAEAHGDQLFGPGGSWRTPEAAGRVHASPRVDGKALK
jgi:hypothetical protein